MVSRANRKLKKVKEEFKQTSISQKDKIWKLNEKVAELQEKVDLCELSYKVVKALQTLHPFIKTLKAHRWTTNWTKSKAIKLQPARRVDHLWHSIKVKNIHSFLNSGCDNKCKYWNSRRGKRGQPTVQTKEKRWNLCIPFFQFLIDKIVTNGARNKDIFLMLLLI